MHGMNPRLLMMLSVLTAAVTLCSSVAQQTNADSGFVAPRQKKPKVETAVEKPAATDITGIVAQAFGMKKPLELINPLAPKKYGGSQDVSWDPDNPEKPQGFILFGIQW